MEAPNPSKRLCQNPNSFSNVPDFNQNHVDQIISSFLSLSNVPWLSLTPSIGCSFDQALEKLFEASGDDDSVKDRLIDHGLELVSLLHESTKSCYRKRATLYNSNSWSLPHELTIKVFSMLDTKSLMQVSACCTMFNKCAMEPLCYSHIDLTTGHVNDDVVSSMIHHADKELRSLKLGPVPFQDESTTSLLTRTCLAPLSSNHGFSGNLLESLHVHNDGWLDIKSMRVALSACSNLTDLKIVEYVINSCPVETLFGYPNKCEQLFIEEDITSDQPVLSTATQCVRNCTNITSLSLIGFELADSTVYLLINSFRKLKYMNLSRTSGIDGSFLRSVGLGCEHTLLETLILRDCFSLKERSILEFLDLLVEGHLRFIQHIDISNKYGLISGSRKYCKPKFYLEKLKEKKKPRLIFVADFTTLSSSLGDTSSSGNGTKDNDNIFGLEDILLDDDDFTWLLV